MTTNTRDIPFDEECPERSDHYREAFGQPAPIAEVEAMRRRWAARFDAAAAPARRSARKAAYV